MTSGNPENCTGCTGSADIPYGVALAARFEPVGMSPEHRALRALTATEVTVGEQNLGPEELSERVGQLIEEAHSLACHAPTAPVMSSLDMALMYLRHAQRQITPERSSE